MRKRSRILFASLIVTLLVGLIWPVLFRHGVEPTFQGKSANDWITTFNKSDGSAYDLIEKNDFNTSAADAVLIKALTIGTGWRHKVYVNVWNKMPAILQRRLPQPVNYHLCHHIASILYADPQHQANRQAVAAMVRLMDEEDPQIRRLAIRLLSRAGHEGRDLLPIFVRALQDRDAGLRAEAAHALGTYHDRPTVVVPLLRQAMKDPAMIVRISAAGALNVVSPQDAAVENVIRLLCDGLKDPDQLNRYNAAAHLGAMGQQPEVVVPALCRLITDPDAPVRYSAVHALGKFGRQAQAAVPALVEALKDKEPLSYTIVSRSLKAIDPEAAAKAGVQ
jgi:HEAT repeat protein